MELTVRKAFEQSHSHLPERIAVILVHSPLAALIGREPLTRMNYLLEIASLHTKAELLAQPGLGRPGVRRIERWMDFHGRRVRDVSESLDSVICNFTFRRSSARKSGRRCLSLPAIVSISEERLRKTAR
ncbi:MULTISPECIES: hypothetical protein [Bradyrhizobium]|uniref:hypothetical protein n=1 Tax=Bradyrhizobium TaxID=374 RepID=UPI001BA5A80B|nr:MULTISPECIES: hypothetical protein [Bradyrhizobium]MBR0815888.1 hypothetical protein [Bradyrhizobium diazoefficiens]WOH71363.1 hypothetical protein RX330_24115 [Bradyrhizobium sp. NDS-1]